MTRDPNSRPHQNERLGAMPPEEILKQLKGSVLPISTAYKFLMDALSRCHPWFIPPGSRHSVDAVLDAARHYRVIEGPSSMGELAVVHKRLLFKKVTTLEAPHEWIPNLVELFDLKEVGSSTELEPVLSKRVRLLRFAEAGAYAAAFGTVVDEATGVTLIDGLIASGNHMVLDDLVRGLRGEWGEWAKKQAVSRLDEFLGMNAKEKEAFVKSRSHAKKPLAAPLEALLRTWAKEFDLDAEKYCPNLCVAQQKSFLHSFIRRTFQTCDTSYSHFEDYTFNILRNKPELIRWFIQELYDMEFFAEVGRWAMRFHIGLGQYPKVREIMDRGDFGGMPMVPNNHNFYTLKLPSSSILWVSTEKDLLNAMDFILANVDVIALDSEWDSNHMRAAGYLPGGQRHRLPEVAVFQIATKEVVYLLDMLALRESLQKRGGVAMMSVLVSPFITKVAYAFRADIELLSIVGPPFNFLFEQITSLIDFLGIVEDHSRLSVPIVRHSKRTLLQVLFPDGVPAGRGLTALVKGMLGLPLDKKQQASAWRQRPLSCGQVHYAALDAHCLIEIQEKLDKRAAASGYSPSEIRSQVASISRKVEKNRPAEYFAMYGSTMPPPSGPGWN